MWRAYPQKNVDKLVYLGLSLGRQSVLQCVRHWTYSISVYLSRVKSLTHRLYTQVGPGWKHWASVRSGALRSLWSQRQSDYYWCRMASQTPAPGALSLKFCFGCACTQQIAFSPDFGWSSPVTWSIASGLWSSSRTRPSSERGKAAPKESRPPPVLQSPCCHFDSRGPNGPHHPGLGLGRILSPCCQEWCCPPTLGSRTAVADKLPLSCCLFCHSFALLSHRSTGRHPIQRHPQWGGPSCRCSICC